MHLFYCMSSLNPQYKDGNKFKLCAQCGGSVLHLYVNGEYLCTRHDPRAKELRDEYYKNHPKISKEEMMKKREESCKKLS